jgi:hypothetical protein
LADSAELPDVLPGVLTVLSQVAALAVFPGELLVAHWAIASV